MNFKPIHIALTLLLPMRLHAMESHLIVHRVGVMRSVPGTFFDGGITQPRIAVVLDKGEGQYGPYNLKIDWLMDGPDDAPTAKYTVTKANQDNAVVLEGESKIKPETITFIQIDSEKHLLFLLASANTDTISLEARRSQARALAHALRNFSRTVIKLENPCEK